MKCDACFWTQVYGSASARCIVDPEMVNPLGLLVSCSIPPDL